MIVGPSRSGGMEARWDVVMKVGVWDLPRYGKLVHFEAFEIIVIYSFVVSMETSWSSSIGFGLPSFPFAEVKHRCPFSWPSAGTRHFHAVPLWWVEIFLPDLAGGKLSTRSGWTPSWWTLDFSTGGVSKCHGDCFLEDTWVLGITPMVTWGSCVRFDDRVQEARWHPPDTLVWILPR